MRIKYTGPHEDGVHVPELGRDVAPGEIIDVPDDIGARMAESADWHTTSRGKKGEEEE